MNVLSLFDGIGTGKNALERAGIPVDNYLASETDPDSIAVCMKNHENVIQIGDACDIEVTDTGIRFENGEFEGSIDLIIGGNNFADGYDKSGFYLDKNGNPYEIHDLETYLSLKDQNIRFKGEAYLFWEFVRLIRAINPRYFLFENTHLNKALEDIVTNTLQTTPISINSEIFSAQNRVRYYWTNIPVMGAPRDVRRHYLAGILDPFADKNDVSDSSVIKKSLFRFVIKYGYVPACFNAYNVTEIKDKAPTLSRGSMVTSSCAVTLFVPCERGVHEVSDGLLNQIFPTKLPSGRYNLRRLSIKEMERLQTLPDGYVDSLDLSLSRKGQLIGSAWTVNAIAWVLGFIPEEDR